MRWLLLFVSALSVQGCTEDSPTQEPCPRRGPTFRLGISASGGELPSDVQIVVEYGSNTEAFDLRRGNGKNQDVCCRAAETAPTALGRVACTPAPDASTPAQVSTIECELSTNGAARLSVKASGYLDLEETLEAEPLEGEEWEHCDALVTRDLFLQLSRGDAGL